MHWFPFRMVRKLEYKVLQLEQANRSLHEDFAERRREAFSSMRYSRDGHRIVVHSLPMGRIPPRPSMIDTVLVDADRGEIVRPPAEFAEFLATNYSVDGHFALLFDKRGKVQLWRVAPWEPVSALVPVSNGPQAGIQGPPAGTGQPLPA